MTSVVRSGIELCSTWTGTATKGRTAAGAQSQLVAQPEAYEVPPIRIVRRGGDGGSAWTSIAGDWP